MCRDERGVLWILPGQQGTLLSSINPIQVCLVGCWERTRNDDVCSIFVLLTGHVSHYVVNSADMAIICVCVLFFGSSFPLVIHIFFLCVCVCKSLDRWHMVVCMCIMSHSDLVPPFVCVCTGVCVCVMWVQIWIDGVGACALSPPPLPPFVYVCVWTSLERWHMVECALSPPPIPPFVCVCVRDVYSVCSGLDSRRGPGACALSPPHSSTFYLCAISDCFVRDLVHCTIT